MDYGYVVKCFIKLADAIKSYSNHTKKNCGSSFFFLLFFDLDVLPTPSYRNAHSLITSWIDDYYALWCAYYINRRWRGIPPFLHDMTIHCYNVIPIMWHVENDRSVYAVPTTRLCTRIFDVSTQQLHVLYNKRSKTSKITYTSSHFDRENCTYRSYCTPVTRVCVWLVPQ